MSVMNVRQLLRHDKVLKIGSRDSDAAKRRQRSLSTDNLGDHSNINRRQDDVKILGLNVLRKRRPGQTGSPLVDCAIEDSYMCGKESLTNVLMQYILPPRVGHAETAI